VGVLEKIKASTQQNLYAMRAEGINERSVILGRQSSALTFLLNKFKNTKRSFGYRLCQMESFGFSIPHCA
jgi:AAA+ ATPase superfamily predicted ATPase